MTAPSMLGGGRISTGLLESLQSDDAVVRERAAVALGHVDDAAPAVVGALARIALEDPDSAVRAEATNSLAALGASQEDLLNVAIDLLEHPEQTVRARAGWAIGKLDPAVGAVAVARLGERLVLDPAIDGRFGAAWALGRLRASSEAAIRPLEAALQDPEADVRAEAARALGRIGHGAGSVTGTLANLSADPDPLVREQVALALGLVDSGGPQAVSALRSLVPDSVPYVRRAALGSLERLGVGADRDDGGGGPAAMAGAIDGNPLAKRLTEDDGFGRAEAAWLLAKRGDTMDEAITVRLVLQALVDPDSDARWSAVRSIGRVGARSEAVTHAILVVLEGDRDPDVRQAAAAAMATLWSDAPADAIAGLIRALRDQDALVREDAAESLGSIGPAARTASSPLEAAASTDPHGGVRARAATSLSSVVSPN